MSYIPERVQRAEEALWSEPWPYTVKSFLKAKYPWGGDAETLRRFHIGLEPNSWGLPAVLYPMRQLDAEWFYTKRSVQEGPKYEHPKGATAPLFLPVPPQEDIAYLTEGHPDTITARWLGFKAMGIMGTSSWREHLDYLAGFRELRVVMDADAAGWKTAEQLYLTLCNVRLIFLYPPDVFFEPARMLTRTPRPDPRCLEGGTGHGEHKREGLVCKVWLEPYCDQKLDLSDLAMKWPNWTRLLLNEGEGPLFGPRHSALCSASGEGCSRSRSRLEGRRVPQAGLPRGEALPWSGGETGLRRRPSYMGVGW